MMDCPSAQTNSGIDSSLNDGISKPVSAADAYLLICICSIYSQCTLSTVPPGRLFRFPYS